MALQASPIVLPGRVTGRGYGWVAAGSTNSKHRVGQSHLSAFHDAQQHFLHSKGKWPTWPAALLGTSLALSYSRRRCLPSGERKPFRTCLAAAQYGDEFVGEAVDTELADSLRQRTLESLDLDYVLQKLQALCYTSMAAEMAVDPEELMANSAEA